MQPIVELLRKLSEAHGPPGREDEIRSIILEELKGLVENVYVDSLGNVIAERHGPAHGPKVMLAAYMDEVSLIVKHVEEDGFLRFELLGGVDTRVLLSQRVLIHVPTATIPGVIGAKPPHVLSPEDMKKPVETNEMYIDIGAKSREEVAKLGVRVGVPATFDARFISTAVDGTYVGKAFDDRIGCVVGLSVIGNLRSQSLPCSLGAVFTVQEEVGLRGAGVAAYKVNPDLAFVLEGTFAVDTPGVEPKDYVSRTGYGPAIRVMDSSMITQSRILDYMVEVAEKEAIPFQLQLSSRGATDAGRIHLTREGIPTGVIAVPCRYLHSPSLMLNIQDVMNAVRLVEKLVLGVKSREQFSFRSS